jgi:hypothetical protein
MSTFHQSLLCTLRSNNIESIRTILLRHGQVKSFMDVLAVRPLGPPRNQCNTSSTVLRFQLSKRCIFSATLKCNSSSSTTTNSPLCANSSTSSNDGDDNGPARNFSAWNTSATTTSTRVSTSTTHEILVGDDACSRPTISTSDVRVGNFASIRRTFGPNDNAQALLLCGGASLARHASFDPTYARAREWIRSHAVGPAVVEHILIQGLVAALVEAALPNRVPLSYQMTHHRPLIVGVEVEAIITVTDVRRDTTAVRHDDNDCTSTSASTGILVTLRAECKRVRDGTCVADGIHKIWLPDT